MSLQQIYAHQTIGITDLKRGNIIDIIDKIAEPIAVLKRDAIKCYLVPEKFMQKISEILEDVNLAELVNQRIEEEYHLAKEIDIDDL